MAELRDIDLNWIARRLPVPVVKAMQSRAGRCFLAGGFIRATIAGEEPKDIDLFVPTYNEAMELATQLFGADAMTGGRGPGAVLRSDFAYTGTVEGVTVQVIHRWTFASPADVLSHFDFTVARAAVWWDIPKASTGIDDFSFVEGEAEWAGECDDAFYPDLAAKRLVYTTPADPEPGGTMLRLLKFAARGYRMPLNSLGGLLGTLASHMDSRIDRGEMTTKITENLRSVDPGDPPDWAAA